MEVYAARGSATFTSVHARPAGCHAKSTQRFGFGPFECTHLPYVPLKRRFLRGGKVFAFSFFAVAGALHEGPASLWSVDMYEWNRICRAMKGNGPSKCLNCRGPILLGSSRQLSDAHGVIGTICQKCRNINRTKDEGGKLIKDATKEEIMAARLRRQITALPAAIQVADNQPASSHATEELTCVVPTCCKHIVVGQSKMLTTKDGKKLGQLCPSCKNSLRPNREGTHSEKLQRFVVAVEAANVSSRPTANRGPSSDAAATTKGQDVAASASQDAFHDKDACDGGVGGDETHREGAHEHEALEALPDPPKLTPKVGDAFGMGDGSAWGTSRHGSCLSPQKAAEPGDGSASPGMDEINLSQYWAEKVAQPLDSLPHAAEAEAGLGADAGEDSDPEELG